jgi:hypothetical protein
MVEQIEVGHAFQPDLHFWAVSLERPTYRKLYDHRNFTTVAKKNVTVTISFQHLLTSRWTEGESTKGQAFAP